MLKNKNFPFFKQTDQFDCGPACLKMICKFYGRNINIEELRELCKISPDGVSGNNLLNALNDLGFHTFPATINLESLIKEAPLPCIIYWRDRHFVIVHKIKNDKVYVADPLHGLIVYKKNEFAKAWQNTKKLNSNDEGVVILFEPSANFFLREESNFNSGLKSLLPYLTNYKKYIFQVFIGLFVGVIIQLIIPFITQSLVDKGINYKDIQFVYVLLIAQLMLFFSSYAITVIRTWLLLFIGSRMSILITSDFLTRLLRKSLSFFDSKTPGDILQRINESNRLESFLNQAPERIFSYFNAIVFLAILIYYSFKIFIIFSIGIVLYTVWINYFMKKREELDFKRFDATAKINSSLIQTVNGIQEIKVNNSESRHIGNWERERISYYKNAISQLKLANYQNIGGQIINEFKNILITFTAALLVINEQITFGALLAIQYIVGQANAPLLNMVDFFQLLQNAKLSIRRFKEVEHITKEEKLLNRDSLLKLPSNTGDIKIKNLYFSYNSSIEDCVLKNINLKIPSGKITAIVGSSGGGKTTLVKLLLKLYTPTTGEINIGDINLNNLDTKNWRKHCSCVLQDGYIFSDTIANNITESVPDEDVKIQQLLKATKIANIEKLINDLPSGYNSMIGPAGSSGRTLSGGQRQRVLIARAIYKNSNFLFFDEATSSLDARNEKVIVDNLKEFTEKRTVVVVAHRLSTVKNADQIVVIEDGEIKEIGNHSKLTKAKGFYYNLIKNQLELGN